MSDLAARIAARARRLGPLPWSVFMDAALYDDNAGFYAAGGGAGRRGDFVTSPELGRVFATVLAQALDKWWDALGQPDPYLVVEAGAGTGTLARDVLAAQPACSPALRYVLVERSARLREAQVGRVPLELPAFVLGPAAAGGTDTDEDDDSLHALSGRGPLATSLAELPAVGFTGIVLANELLDNLAFDLLEWRGDAWQEVRVAAPGSGEDRLTEALVPAAPDAAAVAARLARGCRPREGARLPLQRAAASWLRQALSIVRHGRLVLFDYAATTATMACSPWPSWLRTFRLHRPGGPALEAPGSQDITCVVAVDQLAAIRPPSADCSQAEWLAAHGIEAVIQAASSAWQERAAIGDLKALAWRGQVHEARALIDPEGLGGFRALEWVVP